MFSLITILKENIREANLDRDVDRNNTAEKYIGDINNLIDNYKSDNRKIKVSKVLGHTIIEIFFKDLTVNIQDTNAKSNAEFIPKTGGKPAEIRIYKARIESDPKLTVKFDESAFKHEFTHNLDYKNVSDPKQLDKRYQQDKQKDTTTNTGYTNNPFEVNAYFFQRIMPNVMQYVEKQKEVPNDVGTFIKGALSDPKSKEFVDDLSPDNKKRILKRLGTYHDVLKNGAQQNNGMVDPEKVQSITKSFIQKLKQKIGFK